MSISDEQAAKSDKLINLFVLQLNGRIFRF